MKNNQIITTLAVAAGLLACASNARANAKLWIFEGATLEASQFYAGSSGTETLGASGTGWSVSATIDWSSTGTPFLDLSSIDATVASKPLTIIASDNWNPTPGGQVLVQASGHKVKGNLTGTDTSYYSNDNKLGDTDTWLATLSVLGDNSVDATINAPYCPYSLTEVVTLNSGAGTDSLDDSLTVPDGGMTLTMLGAGFSALAGIRRFGKKA